MTDYEFTDKLTITLILWDRDRRDECYAVLRPVVAAGQLTFLTYDVDFDRDQPGMEVTRLSVSAEVVDELITGLRAHTYALRRAEVRPRPQDHKERRGRRPGPCIECLATGWIVAPARRRHRNPRGGWFLRPIRWQPCPRCLDHGHVAA